MTSFALELVRRNDGYLVDASDPEIVALRRAGVITTKDAGGGYVIARIIPIYVCTQQRLRHSRKWEMRAERELAISRRANRELVAG